MTTLVCVNSWVVTRIIRRIVFILLVLPPYVEHILIGPWVCCTTGCLEINTQMSLAELRPLPTTDPLNPANTWQRGRGWCWATDVCVSRTRNQLRSTLMSRSPRDVNYTSYHAYDTTRRSLNGRTAYKLVVAAITSLGTNDGTNCFAEYLLNTDEKLTSILRPHFTRKLGLWGECDFLMRRVVRSGPFVIDDRVFEDGEHSYAPMQDASALAQHTLFCISSLSYS